MYTLSPEEYLGRIHDGQHVYVLKAPRGVIGFMCGYSATWLAEHGIPEKLAHECRICRAIQDIAANRGHKDYVFVDQIAVIPGFQNHGLGEALFGTFCSKVSGPYYAAMLEAPIRNPRIDYWCSRGFLRVGRAVQDLGERFPVKVKVDPLRALDWGLYLLPDCGFRPRRSSHRETDGV